MSIPYALVGVGGFGRQHLATLTELEQEGALRLVAICEPGIRNLPDLAAELTARGVRIHEDFDALLTDSSDLEAITIAAPIPCHLPMARACVARGLFVYLEKPPVPLLDQWQDLMDADRDSKIAVGFQLIESGWNQHLKREILSGVYGTLREIRVVACWPRNDAYYHRARWAGQMSLDGEVVFDGPATNALAHLVHQTMFLASPEAHGFDAPVAVRGELYRARPIQSYDTACLGGRFASGVTFRAALTHASEVRLPYILKIVGSDGWAEVSEEGELVRNHLGQVTERKEDADPFKDSYRRFLRYVSGAAPRPSTLLRDVKGYVSATNGMLLSSQSIRQIDPAFVRYVEKDGVYTVHDIARHALACLETGELFSDAGLPWAAATPEVDLRNFTESQRKQIRQHFGARL